VILLQTDWILLHLYPKLYPQPAKGDVWRYTWRAYDKIGTGRSVITL